MKRNNYEIIKKKNNKLQISVSYKRFNLINNYKDNSPNDNNYSKKRNIYKMINIDKLLNKDNDDIYKFKNIILSASQMIKAIYYLAINLDKILKNGEEKNLFFVKLGIYYIFCFSVN